MYITAFYLLIRTEYTFGIWGRIFKILVDIHFSHLIRWKSERIDSSQVEATRLLVIISHINKQASIVIFY